MRDTYVDFLQGKNIMNIYTTFAKDYLYNDPNNLVTFIDNHDVARTMYFTSQNIDQAKLAYVMLFTTRGIPQILYGSEIGMVGSTDHGELRMGFPGGFLGDKRDAFTKEGRTDFENELFDFMQKILSIRNEHSALSVGKFVHFPPRNNIYIYFKENENEKILIVINNNLSGKGVNISREMGREFSHKSAIDLWTKEKVSFNQDNYLTLEGKSFKILKLK
jgi:glycosidase